MDNLLPSLPSQSDQDEEIQRLVGEVAKRHKIIVAPNDPLFVYLTLLELVLARHLDKSDSILQSHRDAYLDAMDRAAASAKETGTQLITAAADYVSKQARASIGDLSEALTRSAAAERAKIDLAARDARRVLWLGSCVLAAVFSILVGIAIGTWLAPAAKDRILLCPSFAQPHA